MDERPRRTNTPLPVKIALAVAIVGGLGWWVADRNDRRGNEQRLAEVASAIAGRDVEIACPGPLKRVFGYETTEGSVRFDERGRPADEARLEHAPCENLDALAEGRRDGALACLAAGGADCGEGADLTARAVDVLAHESWHLAGETDEAVTECRALQTIPMAAQRLGASEQEGRGLAKRALEVWYPQMPGRYRSTECQDGAKFDLNRDSAVWP